ncbi:TM2 domain-containing protein [Pseudomonas frederiksbergensis]
MASVQSELLVEQKVANARKSTGLTYLLFFVLGAFGAHRFYLGKKESAIVMLGLGLVGCMFWQLMIVSLIWCTVDGFLIPGFIRELDDNLRREARREVALLDQGLSK